MLAELVFEDKDLKVNIQKTQFMIVRVHFVHSAKTGANIWKVPQVTVLPKSEIALLCFVLLLLSSLGSLTQRCVALCCSAESIEISLKVRWPLLSY